MAKGAVAPVLLAAIAAVSAAGLRPSVARAQQFPIARFPPDVTLEILPRPYVIRGSTAEEMLTQMATLGPPGVVSFPYWFEWRYRSEELPTAFGRNASGVCRVSDFKVDFDVTATYPVWEAPPDASPELAAAWAEFQAQVTRRWEAHQEGVLEFGREIIRQVRRLEAPCLTVQARTREIVEELRDESSEAARAAALAGEHVVLRWPPPAYVEALLGSREPAVPRVPPPPTPPSPEPATAPTPSGDAVPIPDDLYDALAADLRRTGRLRVVAGIRHLGETRFLRAFGSDDSLSARTPVELPPFTDVLVGTLASVLEREGKLMLQSPLSTYLPRLSPRLGSVTLQQLLAHRSGLDNARVPPSIEWSAWIDRLDDRALFTEPGAVYSYSAFNFPLAVRAIEAATNLPLPDLLSDHLLAPAQMEATTLGTAARGLPIARTSGLDLMRFAAAWLDGAFSGVPVFPRSGGSPAPGRRSFAGGVWRDWVGDHERTSLLCSVRGAYAVGLEIFPRTNSAIVFLAQEWPTNTARYVLSEVGTELGVGTEIFQPIALIGDGRLDLPPSSCTPPTWNDQRVQDPGAPAAVGDWPGSYTNGDRRFVLQEIDGTLAAIPFEQPLAVTHHSGDLHFVTMDRRPFFPFRLTRDEEGRRYVVLDDRAYIHDADRPAS